MALPAGLENQSFCFVQVGDAVLGWPTRVLLTRTASQQRGRLFLEFIKNIKLIIQLLIIHHGGLVSNDEGELVVGADS